IVDCMKPLFVGESNPYGADPEFALYPAPRGCSGDRLCRLVLRMDPDAYLDSYERANLCAEPWSTPGAREAARRSFLARDYLKDGSQVVMLGANVTNAFGFNFAPFVVYAERFVCLPHPSGLSRAWHEHGAFDKARGVLRRVGVVQ